MVKVLTPSHCFTLFTKTASSKVKKKTPKTTSVSVVPVKIVIENAKRVQKLTRLVSCPIIRHERRVSTSSPPPMMIFY